MSPSTDTQWLIWRYGHTPVGTDMKQRFHSGEYAGIRLEGQDLADTRVSECRGRSERRRGPVLL
jgi:hypothetical protein